MQARYVSEDGVLDFQTCHMQAVPANLSASCDEAGRSVD